MNTDLVNLLESLRRHSDDEVTYLALADWCLEQPDEATQARGEHVRLSQRLGGLPKNDPAVYGLREQVRAVEKRWRVAWMGPLREIGHRCDFLPGGLVKLEVTHGRAVRARAANVAPLTRQQFAWVSSLVARAITADDLRWLAGVLPAGFVRSFQVEVTEITGLAGVLPSCQWIRGLRALDVHSYTAGLADADVIQLAALDDPRELDEFRLGNASLGVRGCAALGGFPALGRLRSLTLFGCGLAGPGLRALVSVAEPPVATLELHGNALAPDAAEILAGWPALRGVRKLTLDRNPLGDDGLAVLARSPYLAGLRELSVQQCELTTRGLKALAAAPWGALESLDVCGNEGVGDAGLIAVCESSSLATLRKFGHSRFHTHGIRQRTVAALNARFGA